MTSAFKTNKVPDEVTATVSAGKTYDTGLADAFAEGNPWFPQLPAAKQAEVVKYAVLDQHAQERRPTPETEHA
jgi:hypothetical protein